MKKLSLLATLLSLGLLLLTSPAAAEETLAGLWTSGKADLIVDYHPGYYFKARFIKLRSGREYDIVGECAKGSIRGTFQGANADDKHVSIPMVGSYEADQIQLEISGKVFSFTRR